MGEDFFLDEGQRGIVNRLIDGRPYSRIASAIGCPEEDFGLMIKGDLGLDPKYGSRLYEHFERPEGALFLRNGNSPGGVDHRKTELEIYRLFDLARDLDGSDHEGLAKRLSEVRESYNHPSD